MELSNSTGCGIIQNNHGTVIVIYGNSTGVHESELLRIYCELDVRRRVKLLNLAVDLHAEAAGT